VEKVSFYIASTLFFSTLFFLFRAAFLKGRLFLYLMNNKYDKYCELTTFNEKVGPGFYIFSKVFNYVYCASEEDGAIESDYKGKIKVSLLVAAGAFSLLIAFVVVLATIVSA